MIHKTKQLLTSLAKSLEDNETLATPLLAAKLAKCIKLYPEDKTMGVMHRVISQMVQNNTNFIKKSDLKSLYNKLYNVNTKFAELFQDEVGEINKLQSSKIYPRDNSSSSELNVYEAGDAILANALNSVFDNQLPVKMYSEVLAKKAQASVFSTLDAWNLKPNKLEISDGNDKFLIIKADYETPKGITSFFVPVEITNNNIIKAEVFMGNTGPQELNNNLIKKYLTTYAGNKLSINGNKILKMLTAATAEDRTISSIDMAIIKLNENKSEKTEFSHGQITGQKIAEASVKDVEVPKSKEFESFEKQFDSAYGRACYQFGADKVKIARDVITRELIGYGHKNPQIAVNKIDENNIFYSVALDAGRVGFTIPVKIADGKVIKPSVIICNGAILSFNKQGVNQLYVDNNSDFKAAAVASPQFDLKPSDLLNNIRDAIEHGNHAKAEDALNVLANTGDQKAYAVGFQLFLNCLSKKEATPTSTCSKVIKNATSEHPICSHTNLPIHKVYQDKFGNCRPLYRRGMDESYEGVSFINSKIFG